VRDAAAIGAWLVLVVALVWALHVTGLPSVTRIVATTTTIDLVHPTPNLTPDAPGAQARESGPAARPPSTSPP
jgi:hypothetical protein